MAQNQWALHYAVRLRVVLKYYGQCLFVLAAVVLPPLGVSLATGGERMAAWFGGVVLFLIAGGYALNRFRPVRRVQSNEALSIIALMFLTAPLIFALPLWAAGMPAIDALFECVSGCTTTGLTVLENIDTASAAMLFTRAWMQWFGGLGISILSVALVTVPGLVARSLAYDVENDDLVGSTRSRARTFCAIFAILTVVVFALVAAVGVGLFDALLYTLATVSTGGFAPHADSLGALSLPAQAVLTLGALAGAVPLALYAQLKGRMWRSPLTIRQALVLVCVAVALAAILTVVLRFRDGFPLGEALRHGFMLAGSAQTTSGFSTVNVSELSAMARVLLLPAMAVGGCAGSTAGGIKILRALILFNVVRTFVRRSGLARHAVDRPGLGEHAIEEEDIRSASALFLLYVSVVTVSWIAFLAHGGAPLESLFEVVSAVGTVGLSSGMTAPDLPDFLKLVLCADMWLGRLEILAWIVLFSPRTWIGNRMEEK